MEPATRGQRPSRGPGDGEWAFEQLGDAQDPRRAQTGLDWDVVQSRPARPGGTVGPAGSSRRRERSDVRGVPRDALPARRRLHQRSVRRGCAVGLDDAFISAPCAGAALSDSTTPSSALPAPGLRSRTRRRLHQRSVPWELRSRAPRRVNQRRVPGKAAAQSIQICLHRQLEPHGRAGALLHAPAHRLLLQQEEPVAAI
jgi:hypothetical protein